MSGNFWTELRTLFYQIVFIIFYCGFLKLSQYIFFLWGPTKETKQLDIKQTRLRATVLLTKLLDIKLERFVRFLSSSHVILYYCFC